MGLARTRVGVGSLTSTEPWWDALVTVIVFSVPLAVVVTLASGWPYGIGALVAVTAVVSVVAARAATVSRRSR